MLSFKKQAVLGITLAASFFFAGSSFAKSWDFDRGLTGATMKSIYEVVPGYVVTTRGGGVAVTTCRMNDLSVVVKNNLAPKGALEEVADTEEAKAEYRKKAEQYDLIPVDKDCLNQAAAILAKDTAEEALPVMKLRILKETFGLGFALEAASQK